VDDKNLARSMGATDCLLKPIVKSELIRSLSRHIRQASHDGSGEIAGSNPVIRMVLER
jgi:DNA-binding response OmpR family regulator